MNPLTDALNTGDFANLDPATNWWCMVLILGLFALLVWVFIEKAERP